MLEPGEDHRQDSAQVPGEVPVNVHEPLRPQPPLQVQVLLPVPVAAFLAGARMVVIEEGGIVVTSSRSGLGP